jgi:tetratricopeptide (TPR) repeat protein
MKQVVSVPFQRIRLRFVAGVLARLGRSMALGGFFCLLATSLSTGCSSSDAVEGKRGQPAGIRSRSASSGKSKTEAEWETRARGHAAFAAGLLRGMKNDLEGFSRYFEKAYEADPSNEALALDVARRRLQAGQITNALPVLERAASRTNASSEVHSLHGVALFQVGRTNEALAAYLRAVEQPLVMPSVVQATVRLLVAGGRLGEAVETLDRVSKRTGTNQPSLLLDLADLYLLCGSVDAARTNLTTSRALDLLGRVRQAGPADASLNLRLADRYSALGRMADSEAVLKEFQQRVPRSPAALARLAEMYLRSGRVPEAGAQLEALRKIDPSNPMTYYLLGSVAMEEKQFEKARNHYERVILLNPGFEPAYADLSVAFFNLERPEEAVAVLERARRDFAPNFRVEFLLGAAFSQLKRFDDAWARYQTAEKLGSTNEPPLTDHRFYFQVGAMLERKGDEVRCIEYLEKSLELQPDYDEALNHLGYLWAEKGENLERAQAMIELALQSEPDNAAYLDSLGWVLFKRGRFEEALSNLRKAVAGLERPDSTVFDHLGDCLAALGRWSEAREAWEKSLAVEKSEAVAKKLSEAAGR